MNTYPHSSHTINNCSSDIRTIWLDLRWAIGGWCRETKIECFARCVDDLPIEGISWEGSCKCKGVGGGECEACADDS